VGRWEGGVFSLCDGTVGTEGLEVVGLELLCSSISLIRRLMGNYGENNYEFRGRILLEEKKKKRTRTKNTIISPRRVRQLSDQSHVIFLATTQARRLMHNGEEKIAGYGLSWSDAVVVS